MKQKIIILCLILTIVFGNVSICKASPNTFADLNKPCNIYSLSIPTAVSTFAQMNFQTIFESIRIEPERYGISASHLENMYLGNGFNIFELNNNVTNDAKIYYYPVMYNNKIEAIFSVTINHDGSCNATIGVQFAKKLQNVFDTCNDGSPFILFSSNGNIYAQNTKGVYPISVYKSNTVNQLNKISYGKLVANVKSRFFNNTVINTKKKFNTISKNCSMIYKSNTVKAALKSTFLPVPITSQYGAGCCWAACVASIVNYKRGTNLDALQICDHFGIGYNVGAYPETAVKALEYYGMSYATDYGSILSDSGVESWINANHPLYMDSHPSNSSLAGHATVIRGYMVGSGYIQLSMMNAAKQEYEAAYCHNGTYSYTMDNITYYWDDTVISY